MKDLSHRWYKTDFLLAPKENDPLRRSTCGLKQETQKSVVLVQYQDNRRLEDIWRHLLKEQVKSPIF
jgi:hypothetical protein